MKGGRCACGQARLAPFYPAIELAALAIALVATAFAEPGQAVSSAVLGWTLLTLPIIDLRDYILPDVLTLPLLVLGLAMAWWQAPAELIHHVLGAALGYGALVGINALYRSLRHGDGLGRGDAKLLAAAGAWLGWQALSQVVLIAAFSALALSLSMGFLRHDPGWRRVKIAFGPYHAFGFWLVWLFGCRSAGAF